MALQILLNGAKGRMGLAIAAVAGETNAVIRAGLDAGDDLAVHIARCDVIIDFSSPQATAGILEIAHAHHKAVVIGTTGHTAAEKAHLLTLAARGSCVWAGNFSVGVNLLFALT